MTGKYGRILVTGGSGFLGSHLVEALARQCDNVRVLVHYNSRNDLGNLRFLPPKLLSNIEVIRGDIQDADCVYDAVSCCSRVFHLAALIDVPHSYEAPRSYVSTNILGTLNVLEAVRRWEINRMVYVSSSEIYGNPIKIPMDENHPLQPQNPYSATKIAADKLVESYHKSFELQTVVVRAFNAYGPRQSVRAVIPNIITQLLSGKNEVQLKSLNTKRDFTFVGDVIDGFIKAAECDDAIGETINIGSGKNISMGELAKMIIGIMNPEAKIVSESDDEEIGPVCDNGKAFRMLGWVPETSIEDGLKKTIEFISEAKQECVGI